MEKHGIHDSVHLHVADSAGSVGQLISAYANWFDWQLGQSLQMIEYGILCSQRIQISQEHNCKMKQTIIRNVWEQNSPSEQ